MGFNQFTVSRATNEWISMSSFPLGSLDPLGMRLPWPLPNPHLLSAPRRSLQRLWLSLPTGWGSPICSWMSLTAGWAYVYHLPSISTLNPSFSIENLGLHVAVYWFSPFCWATTGTQVCHSGPSMIKPWLGAGEARNKFSGLCKKPLRQNWRIKIVLKTYVYFLMYKGEYNKYFWVKIILMN